MLFDVLTARPYNPFTSFERLFAEFDRVASTAARPAALDVFANDSKALIAYAAPGLDPDSVSIEVLGDTLSIHGKPLAATEQEGWIRKERRPATLHHSLRLPFAVDEATTSANYRDGVLTIRAPRLASTKPRRIAVEAA
jgi:HSP20 family protein